MSGDDTEDYPKFLTFNQVKARVSLSRAEIYRRIAAGTFPKPIRIGLVRVAWLETDIVAWQRSVISGSAAVAAKVGTTPAAAPRFLRLPEVVRRTGLSKTTIYDLMKAGEFPRPVSVTRFRVAWIESEIEAWLQQKIESRPLQSEPVVPNFRNNRPELIPPKRIGKSTMKTAARETRTHTESASVGSWAEQNAEGRRRAQALLSKMSAEQAPFMLERAASRMTDEEVPYGVLVGFMQVFGEAAIRGANVL